MKVEVYKEKGVDEQEPVLRLRLHQTSNGAQLFAVDEAGKKLFASNICCIGNDGKLALPSGINSSLGLSLSSSGRILTKTI